MLHDEADVEQNFARRLVEAIDNVISLPSINQGMAPPCLLQEALVPEYACRTDLGSPGPPVSFSFFPLLADPLMYSSRRASISPLSRHPLTVNLLLDSHPDGVRYGFVVRCQNADAGCTGHHGKGAHDKCASAAHIPAPFSVSTRMASL